MKKSLVSFTEPHSCSNHRLQARHISGSSVLLESSSPSSHVTEGRSCSSSVSDAELITAACTRSECVMSSSVCVVVSENTRRLLTQFSQQQQDFVEILPQLLNATQVSGPVGNLITCNSKSYDSAHGNESHLPSRTAMNSKHSPVTTRPGDDDLYLFSMKRSSS